MGIQWQITFSKIELNFTQFVNQNVKIQGRRLYSPSLEDVAWLEDTQSIFLIFHTLSVNWLGRWTSRRGSREKNYRQMYGKLERLLAKLHPPNLVNTIFYLVFKRFDSKIVENSILEKVIFHRIPIQTL